MYERVNLRSERAYYRPGMATLRSWRVNLSSGKAYLGKAYLGKANLRPVMVNMRSGRAYLGPKSAYLRPRF